MNPDILMSFIFPSFRHYSTDRKDETDSRPETQEGRILPVVIQETEGDTITGCLLLTRQTFLSL